MTLSVGQLAIGIGIVAIVLAALLAADVESIGLLFAAYFLTLLGRVRRYTLSWCPAVIALMVVSLSASGMEMVSSWLMSTVGFLACGFAGVMLTLLHQGRARNRLALISALSLLCIVSVPVTHWPFRLAFAASRPAFEVVANRLHDGQAVPVPTRVGRFRIKGAELRDGRPCLWADTSPGGATGFVRNPLNGVNTTRGRHPNTMFNLWSAIVLGDDWAYISED